MLYSGKPWQEEDRIRYWSKTHTERLALSEGSARTSSKLDVFVLTFKAHDFGSLMASFGRPSLLVISITVIIFHTPSDDDIIEWEENTNGHLILYHRYGNVYFAWLQHWEAYGERTPASTTASATPTVEPANSTATASFRVRWSDIPPEISMFRQLPDNERVLEVLNEMYLAVHASSTAGSAG